MSDLPKTTDLTATLLANLPGSLSGLRAADAQWTRYRTGEIPSPTVVTQASDPLPTVAWDVAICGGTLGILLGAALAQRGWRVILLEKGILQGREQEWNISRAELEPLLELELLTEAELEAAIATEYNPARIQFGDGTPIWVRDVLNVGVSPRALLATLKAKFLAAGGTLVENTAFEHAIVHPNGVALTAGGRSFTARLVLDAMGHFSPIVRQARGGKAPDGICLVVGTCATGFPDNTTGDLIVSFTPIQNQCQYFWEAFPAQDGRTTYLFTYVDTHRDRPSLSALFEEYWRWLPSYQHVDLAAITVKRALFGFFPCYQNSPLRYPWGRLLAIGDSSGSQSPLSFGGFGAMLRHLTRLTHGIDDALREECLSAQELGLLQPYQPNLSVTWLFQRAMRVGVEQHLPPDQINQMLSTIFADMAALGEPTLKPFLQDVVQFSALAKTLLRTSVYHPALVAKILPQVGVPAVLRWLPHYIALAGYRGAYTVAQHLKPWLRSQSGVTGYRYHRWMEALQYGTGSDYGE